MGRLISHARWAVALYGISKEETQKQLSEWEKRVLETSEPGDTTLRPAPKLQETK